MAGDKDWSCWEKWFCGQCSPSLEKNVRDTAVLELVFNAFGGAALLYTARDGGLHKSSDWWDLTYLVVSTPTLLLLLWHIERQHPDAIFLRRFNLWCIVVLAAYSLGALVDVHEVVTAVGQRRTTARLMALLSVVLSLALFANIVYFNSVLLRRMHGAPPGKKPAEGHGAATDERRRRPQQDSTERTPLAEG